jgi:hypothetical protein
MSHLLMVGEVTDTGGMASTTLAEAVAYPGSSIAFAQLLSGMERSGLIEREVRGKRTYRIIPTRTAAPARSRPVARAGDQPVPAGGSGEFDYDELARRLLLQVVQRLGAAQERGREPAEDAEPLDGAEDEISLAQTVASLEHKLASVRSRQRRLTEENARLREQLRTAQESLARERAGAERISGRLDGAEVSLLDRLLSPLHDQAARPEEADVG